MDIKIECIEIKSRRAHTAELMSIWVSKYTSAPIRTSRAALIRYSICGGN